MKVFLCVYRNGICVADQVEYGNSFFKRLKGLMGRASLCENQGFYLTPCNSIHTFQMKFPIDVLFLSKEGIVLDIEYEMQPWRIKTAVKGAKATLELAAKTAKRCGIALGDRLVIKQSCGFREREKNLMKKQTLQADEEKILDFKKTFFGLKEKDVFEYIDLLNNNLNKAREVYDGKLEEMKSANELSSYERNSQNEKIQQLTNAHQALLDEHNELLKTIDGQHNLAQELQNSHHEKEQLKNEIENYKLVAGENQRLKKQLTENEVVCQMREQQESKLLSEIDTLKKQNKGMMETFLEKQNHLESDIAEKNLKLTQLLQMHRFTLEQSRSTLGALVTQFDESCKLISQINVE